jgi:hypothetical protein
VNADKEITIESQPQALQQAFVKALPPPTAAKQQSQAEVKKRFSMANEKTEAAHAQDQLSAASDQPAPSAAGAAGAAPAATSAGVYRQRAEAPPGSVATFGSLRGASVAGVPSGKPIHLPSGLEVLSIASAGHRLLAIDKAGTVFLSEDSGGNWRRIAPQWEGRAVLVRTRSVPIPAPAAPAPQAAQSASGAVAVIAQPIAFFEIVNDKNQVFQSTDGTTWLAK